MAGVDFTADRPMDPESARRLQEARGRAITSAQNHLEADLARAGLEQSLANEAVHQFRPEVDAYGDPISRFDPGRANAVADEIESRFGTALDVPGWRNAAAYARGGAEYAKTHADLHGSQDEAYTASRHLMSPERFDYMQKYGRAVDLLRNLRSGDPDTAPQVAVKYYKTSFRNPLARDGWGAATYQRESDSSLQRPMAAFLGDPTSPVAGQLRIGQVIPNAIKTGSAGQDVAMQVAAGNKDFYDRFKDVGGLGEVLDVPDSATPEEYALRQREVERLAQNIATPSWQYVVGRASPFVADVVGTFGEALDPTLMGSVAAAPFRSILSGLARRAAPMTMKSGASALGRQALEEFAGEVPMAAATSAVQAAMPSERTWMDYFFGDGEPEEYDFNRAQRAADLLAGLKRTSPNDIWSARSQADPAPLRLGVGRDSDYGPSY